MKNLKRWRLARSEGLWRGIFETRNVAKNFGANFVQTLRENAKIVLELLNRVDAAYKERGKESDGEQKKDERRSATREDQLSKRTSLLWPQKSMIDVRYRQT